MGGGWGCVRVISPLHRINFHDWELGLFRIFFTAFRGWCIGWVAWTNWARFGGQ